MWFSAMALNPTPHHPTPRHNELEVLDFPRGSGSHLVRDRWAKKKNKVFAFHTFSHTHTDVQCNRFLLAIKVSQKQNCAHKTHKRYLCHTPPWRKWGNKRNSYTQTKEEFVCLTRISTPNEKDIKRKKARQE